MDELLPHLRVALDDPAVRAWASAAGWKSASAAASIWRTRPSCIPMCRFIGAEPFVNGVAKLLALIEETEPRQRADP